VNAIATRLSNSLGKQIHWVNGTNILLAVNCQGRDLGVRN